MEKITTIRSRTVVLPQDNVDTDQIIPARFLTTTVREGLGRHAFADWRYEKSGRRKDSFPLNGVDLRAHRVLVAGANFGSGSSREHAAWALLDLGFQAVISSSIADIFRANALKNGLLPIVVDDETVDWLVSHPGHEVEIDLARKKLLMTQDREIEFGIDAFARLCLTKGVDQLGFLLAQEERITQYEVDMEHGSS